MAGRLAGNVAAVTGARPRGVGAPRMPAELHELLEAKRIIRMLCGECCIPWVTGVLLPIDGGLTAWPR